MPFSSEDFTHPLRIACLQAKKLCLLWNKAGLCPLWSLGPTPSPVLGRGFHFQGFLSTSALRCPEGSHALSSRDMLCPGLALSHRTEALCSQLCAV